MVVSCFMFLYLINVFDMCEILGNCLKMIICYFMVNSLILKWDDIRPS